MDLEGGGHVDNISAIECNDKITSGKMIDRTREIRTGYFANTSLRVTMLLHCIQY
jgi:hypothetical protein